MAQPSRDAPPSPASAASRGGRPRCGPTAAEKHRAHRPRQADRHRLLAELLEALRIARLEDPQLHHAAQQEDATGRLRDRVRSYRTGQGQRPRKESSPPNP